uniref:Uncharacterized protein n=1 Tax=Schistocephalus solidus TaxID=70667 RepID=A0A0X3PQ54_SCHSO
MSRDRGVQWLYFFVTLTGFLCIFFATILPYWYAKCPSAVSRFLRLGFWEICLKDFIATSDQQKVYDGCFYLFDSRIRPLWPHIFSAWFITSQLMHTLALVAFIIVMGICVAWLLDVADSYRSDLVMASLVSLAFIAWLLLTVLGVFGVNTDLEKKEFRRRGQSAWLSDLDQCSLSWCYGLAALSLLLALVSLNILLWCVYPRKEVGGRLSKFAWRWPQGNDLPCCLKSPLYPNIQSDVVGASTVVPPSVFARPTPASLRASQRQRQPFLFGQQPQTRSSPQSEPLRPSHRIDSPPASITSSYDPRPFDLVSVRPRHSDRLCVVLFVCTPTQCSTCTLPPHALFKVWA